MKKLFIQIIKFGGVGIVCTLFEYGLLFILNDLVHVDYLISAAIGFFASTILNYILSVIFVFKVNNGRSNAQNLIVFIIFSAIGFGINQLIMWLGGVWLGTEAMNGIWKWPVKIFATAVVMTFNFITRKLFLERRKGE